MLQNKQRSASEEGAKFQHLYFHYVIIFNYLPWLSSELSKIHNILRIVSKQFPRADA